MARAARAPTATPEKTPAPTTPAGWRDFIAGLLARAEAATARQTDLRTERDALALDLELGDPAAVDAAAVLDDDLAGVGREISQITAAKASAERRLKAAEADELTAQKVARAAELSEILAVRPKAAKIVDDALSSLLEAAEFFVETNLRIEDLSPHGLNSYLRGPLLFDVIRARLCPLAGLGIDELTIPTEKERRKTLAEHVDHIDRNHRAWADSVLTPEQPARAA